ncbi:PREDICTED: uncharacterized protein LOC109179510 [Ipomoea nil]|uniref:uncharacterized protein LOC109179510 n=1 Tax=Ipomoea nil TaxID=35883 RepID=UPI000900C8C7|nr:PREDICTED: uncharacterized protein LOC109179510 [Ipomoea nil]
MLTQSDEYTGGDVLRVGNGAELTAQDTTTPVPPALPWAAGPVVSHQPSTVVIDSGFQRPPSPIPLAQEATPLAFEAPVKAVARRKRAAGLSLKIEGFSSSKTDVSLFHYSAANSRVYLLVYVDDIIMMGNDPSLITSLLHRLSSTFKIRDLGTPGFFLGIETVKTDIGLMLSQRRYMKDILSRAGMTECKPLTTPAAVTPPVSSTAELHDNPTQYRHVVGALQYLTITRPDLSYAVNRLCQFMHTPTADHWGLVKRVLQYIKGTLDYVLQLTVSETSALHAYSDSDWASCPLDRKSIGGYVVFLGSNLISWLSRKQRTVARSSTEAEYKALADVAAEVASIVSLLRELGLHTGVPPTLWCDNLGATYTCANPVFHARTKHAEIDFHFVRDKCEGEKPKSDSILSDSIHLEGATKS